jgi:hypothetical protein
MSFTLEQQSKIKTGNSEITLTHAKSSSSSSHHINNLAMTSSDSLIHLQRTVGNHAVQRIMPRTARFDLSKIDIQPKLKVSKSGDAYEQEADMVAEQVMGMPAPNSINLTVPNEKERLDQKCVACKMKEKEAKNLNISRKLSRTSNPETTDVNMTQISNIVSTEGTSIDANTRRFMESRFGYDFSQVKMHFGAAAEQSARDVGAHAYTVGTHIVFEEGQSVWHTTSGLRLLTHELAHVVQQGRGDPSSSPSQRGSMLEQAADAAVSDFVAGRRSIHVEGASAPGLARQPLSLSKSMDVKQLTDAQLEQEIAMIVEWLNVHPYDNLLSLELERFQAEEWRRSERARKKQIRQQQIADVVNYVNAGKIPKWMKVFPFRPSRGIFRMDVAPIMAWRKGDSIVVKQPLLGVAYTDRFKKDVKTLPWDVFVGGGHALKPHELVGVRLYDEGEKVIAVYAEDLLKFSDASSSAVFLNIGLTALDVVAGPAAGRLVGRVASGISRKVIQPGLTSAALGLAEAAPTAFAQAASRTGVELVETRAASSIAHQAIGQTTRQVAVETVVQSTTRGTQAAGEAIGGGLVRGSLAAPVKTALGIGSTHVAGSTLIQVSQPEYYARLSFVDPKQFDNPVLSAVELAGQQAATVLTNPTTPEGARFIQLCQSRQFTLAGTVFHVEAARQLSQIAASLSGIQIRAEDTIQAGRGGSRLDVTGIDAAGNHYSIDWKTTGRSAFTSKSRAQMQKHSAQYQSNRGASLDLQISKSWVDFVRPLIQNVNWPK